MQETQSLLRPFAIPTAKKTTTNSRNIWLGGMVVSLVFIAGAFYAGKNVAARESVALDSSLTPNNDAETYGWYFYKTAMVTKNGTSSEALRFMMNFTGGFDCSKTPLGCDGYKITCTYGQNLDDTTDWDRQIHYVHAPRLFSQALDKDNLGVDGWQDVREMSMKNMDEEFSAFMHNKIQMYTRNVDERALRLEGSGYKVMRRLSYWTDAKTILAHASTQFSGQIWEFVGLAPKDTNGWQFWKDDECPMAHKVDANISRLEEYIQKINLQSKLDASFFDERNTTFWISTQVATSIQNDKTTMMTDIEDLTGANMKIENSDGCSVTSVSYKNYNAETMISTGDQTTLKFVQNAKMQTVSVGVETYSLSMYEDYISRVHKKYLQKPHGSLRRDRWRNWDHWLDLHVGIKWKEDAGCYDHSKAVTSRMLDNDTPVGKRSINGDGDHYYVGYSGSSMCIEYNTEQCHFGIGETDTCTCNHYNSNELGNNSGTICLHDDIY